eukprot:gene4690-6587_t
MLTLINRLVIIPLFLFLIVGNNQSFANKAKVIITGAAGKTGSLVFKKLLQSSLFDPIGIIRTKKSLKKLLNIGGTQNNIAIADVTKVETLESVFKGAEKLILCTSAVPKINIFSLIKVLFLKIFGIQARPTFSFIKDGGPYYVDWLGAKNQIDIAKKAGIKHIVFLSSMGGTQPDNFLNSIGKVEGDDTSGNILRWKRRAEEYLIESGLEYTIVHPGGLLDKKGGEKEVLIGFNDNFLQNKVRSINREDVAEVCVQSLSEKGAKNRSFDIINDVESTTGTSDWKKFFSTPGNCRY